MWQTSRNWAAKFGPTLVLALVACSVTYAQDVRTNYMPGTDFSKYQTYAWVDEVQGLPAVGGHPDQVLHSQVKQALDSQMAGKGLTKVVDGKPDLLLSYRLAIDKEKQINGAASAIGGWGPWWTASIHFRPVLQAITSALLSLVCMTLVKKLVRIGSAQYGIEPSKKQEKNQERLDKGAQKLLKDFPPGRSK